MNLRFHHIAYAVTDIEKTTDIYRKLGYVSSKTVYDEYQNVNIAFLEKENMPLVELVAPKDENSPVMNILRNNGVSTYHCCYEVDDISSALEELRQLHFMPINKFVPAPAISNYGVIFLYNKNFGLVEITAKL